MFEAEIKRNESQIVAYKVMKGAYAQMPAALGELYGWVGQHGLQPVGMPQGVYLTSPAETPESEAIWEVWAPVAQGALSEPDDRGIGVKEVPPETVASIMHKGPYEDVAPTYEKLGRWTAEQGYRMAGPPRELYYSDPAEVPPSEYLTEIQFPVTKE